MRNQRFTPDFKDDAARQVVERGYFVIELSACIGDSSHSLYKWVKAVTPDKSEKYAAGLVDAKSEILRLRAQLRCLQEELAVKKNGRRVRRPRTRLKCRLIDNHRGRDRIAAMCLVLEVNWVGFKKWQLKPQSDR